MSAPPREEEGEEAEAEADEDRDAEISAHAELSGAADVLYSHRVITDLEPLAMSSTRHTRHNCKARGMTIDGW